jgi:hypothetical protein
MEGGKADLVPAFDHLSVNNQTGGSNLADGTRPTMVTQKNSAEDDANINRTKSTSGTCSSLFILLTSIFISFFCIGVSLF